MTTKTIWSDFEVKRPKFKVTIRPNMVIGQLSLVQKIHLSGEGIRSTVRYKQNQY